MSVIGPAALDIAWHKYSHNAIVIFHIITALAAVKGKGGVE